MNGSRSSNNQEDFVAFVEAVKDATGAELHPKEAESVSVNAIEKTLEELKNQASLGDMIAKKAMIDIDLPFHDLALTILHDNIRKCKNG
ncbi:hypothetical protein MASR2M78_28730 [Treponema sp.]